MISSFAMMVGLILSVIITTEAANLWEGPVSFIRGGGGYRGGGGGGYRGGGGSSRSFGRSAFNGGKNQQSRSRGGHSNQKGSSSAASKDSKGKCGVNAKGNRWRTPGGTNKKEGSAYHYSNRDKSFFYRNDDGSQYFKQHNRQGKFTKPSDPQ